MSWMQEAVREWARNFGHDHPDRAWLLSDLDTWERNPFYCGPAEPHPDEYEYMEPELTIDEINVLLDEAAKQDRKHRYAQRLSPQGQS